jgi:hypothetical protein
MTGGPPFVTLPLAAAGAALLVALLVRFGFLAVVGAQFVTGLTAFPMTADPFAWPGGGALFFAAATLALAAVAFHTSLAGRRLFGPELVPLPA